MAYVKPLVGRLHSLLEALSPPKGDFSTYSGRPKATLINVCTHFFHFFHSIHSGTTSGDVRQSFGAAERERFRKVLVPLFGAFLQKCYSKSCLPISQIFTQVLTMIATAPEECRSRTLVDEAGFLPLSQLDLENEGACTDTISPTSALGTAILEHAGSSSASSSAQNPSSDQPSPASGSTTPLAGVSAQTDAGILPVEEAAATVVNTNPVEENATTIVGGGADTNATEATVLQEEDDVEMEDDETGAVAQENPFPFVIPCESPLPSPCPSPAPEEAPAGLQTPASSGSLPAPSMDVDTTIGNGNASPAIATGDDSQSSAPTRRSQRVSSAVGVDKKASKGSKPKRGKKRALEQSEDVPTNVDDNRTVRTPPAVPLPSSADTNIDAGNSTTSSAPAKRARVTGPRSPVEARSFASSFEIPSDAPDWFKKSFRMLSSKDLGGEWGVLVAAWGHFECRSGFSGGLKLGTKNRPAAVKDWIQRARSPSWRPTIRSVSSYGTDFTLWWQGMQPEWRILRGGKLLRVAGGDWEVLNRPGVNGLLSIMAGLFFWGFEVCDSSNKGEWLDMVVDVEYVVSQLLANI